MFRRPHPRAAFVAFVAFGNESRDENGKQRTLTHTSDECEIPPEQAPLFRNSVAMESARRFCKLRGRFAAQSTVVAARFRAHAQTDADLLVVTAFMRFLSTLESCPTR